MTHSTSGTMARVPVPMPATARPSASVRLRFEPAADRGDHRHVAACNTEPDAEAVREVADLDRLDLGSEEESDGHRRRRRRRPGEGHAGRRWPVTIPSAA